MFHPSTLNAFPLAFAYEEDNVSWVIMVSSICDYYYYYYVKLHRYKLFHSVNCFSVSLSF